MVVRASGALKSSPPSQSFSCGEGQRPAGDPASGDPRPLLQRAGQRRRAVLGGLPSLLLGGLPIQPLLLHPLPPHGAWQGALDHPKATRGFGDEGTGRRLCGGKHHGGERRLLQVLLVLLLAKSPLTCERNAKGQDNGN